MRHNAVRDLFINFFTQAGYKDVVKEPQLHPIDGLQFSHKSVKNEDNARSDIKVLSFWRTLQNTFFDVRIFNPFSKTYVKQEVWQSKNVHEDIKDREYKERIQDVEMASFSPLVFTFLGGAGLEAEIVIKKLAAQLSEKLKEEYADVVNTFRTKLSFALLHTSLLCLRGSKNWNDQYKPNNSTSSSIPSIFESISTHKEEVEFGLVRQKARLQRF